MSHTGESTKKKLTCTVAIIRASAMPRLRSSKKLSVGVVARARFATTASPSESADERGTGEKPSANTERSAAICRFNLRFVAL